MPAALEFIVSVALPATLLVTAPLPERLATVWLTPFRSNVAPLLITSGVTGNWPT